MTGYYFWVTMFAFNVAAQTAPAYPGSSPVEISPSWSYFTTLDDPERVVGHFGDRWRGLGIPVSVDRHRDGSAVVSAFFTRQKMQRAVIVMRSPSGTLAFQLERQLEGTVALATKGEGSAGFDDGLARQLLPNHPERSGPSNGNGLWPLSIDEARARWETILAKAGYQTVGVAQPEPRDDLPYARRHLTLRHRHEGREIWTHLVEVDPGMTAWVALPMASAALLEARAP